MKKTVEYERKAILSLEQYKRYFEMLSQRTMHIINLQNNFYYDDSRFSLFKCNETLRVRQISETLTIEYKHNKSYHEDIHRSDENAVRISTLPSSIILNSLKTQIVGSLLTERVDFQFEDIKVSLDKSIYLGITDYEIEIETNKNDKLPPFLYKMIESANPSPMGKYHRFVSKLRLMSDTIYKM